MTYRGRNAARRAHKLAIQEAAVKKRCESAVTAWSNAHPPRIHPDILSPERFVDDYSESGDWLGIIEMPPPCKESPPVYHAPMLLPRRVTWSIPEGEKMHLQRMRMMSFRLVVWKLRADQSEFRWFTWEPMGVDGEGSDRERYPRAQKALAYLARAEHVLEHLGLMRLRVLEHEPSRYAYDDWARKDLKEVLEILRLELSAWLGTIPAVREGVAASSR